MKSQLRPLMFIVTILTVLALSAFWTLPAFADDEVPPPAPTTETVEPPAEALPVEESPPAEVLAEVPEDTTVVVTGADGEIIPLASQEAADAIATGDPMWCPAGVNPGSATCSIGYTSLTQLVTDFDNGAGGQTAFAPSGNGVIWIEGGTDTGAAGTSIVMNGTVGGFIGMANFSLILKGGWNGCNPGCVNTVNTANPSVFDQSLSIINWNGDITLSDITFSGVTVGSALNNAALDIETDKKITLTNIDINGNDIAGAHGAYLDNYEGVAISDVVITNSSFSDNGAYGLQVFSDGMITVTNLVANSNGSTGAFLSNSGSGTPKAVTLIGPSNQTKFNGFTGLVVYSKGAVTVNSLAANNNGSDGAFIDNQTSGSAASVSFTGTNTFNGNSSDGLEVYSKGLIKINNISANNNSGGFGAFLDNHTAATPQAVTISVSGSNPDSTFNDNFSGGLAIHSKGVITVSGVVANGNSNGNGVTLKNDYPGAVGGITVLGWGMGASNNNGYGLNASSLGAITISNLWAWSNTASGALLDNSTGTGAVTITGDTSYGFNTSDGLIINSKGAITLGTIYTESNGGSGMVLDNSYGTQNVTLNGAHHDFNNNTGSGLEVYSYGMITINNLYAYSNGVYGALLDNCLQGTPGVCTATVAKAVTLNGSSNVLEWNDYTGLDITSKGVITTNNLTARDNGGFGAYFDNQMAGSVGTINVKNAATYWAEFARNALDGLKLHSNGTITVMDLDAFQNGQAGDPDWGYGVYLDNASGGGAGNILLGTNRANWVNGLNGNFLSGLEVYTNGAITLSNIRANNNGGDNTIDPVYGYGAVLNSNGALKAVLLNGSGQFNGNSSGGLYVNSLGAITLNNIEASDNGQNPGGGDGAQLNNSSAATPQVVTLKGNNSFFGNYNNGLQVISKGAITVNNITSNYNGDGVELYNTASGTGSPQNVTLTGFGDFYGNYNNGLDIYSFGIITLNNVNANDNGQSGGFGYGAYLDNYTGNTQIKAVTLNGYNSFYNNFTGGLEIHSLGAIIVNNMDASTNTGFGALLDNNDGSTPSAVTILGGAFTADNGGYGLQVTTKGVITINVIDAWIGNNGTYGWNLDNNFTGAVGGVTLSSVNSDWAFDFVGNGSFGLQIQSLGSINVSGLDASQNGGFGAILNNAFPGSVGTVTLTVVGRNDFSSNSGIGLSIFSNRVITINNLYADSNTGAGVLLNNSSSGTGSPQNVTINGSGEFYNNGNTGLVVDTYGAITLNNISANDNGQNGGSLGWGAWLDNCGYNLGTCNAVTPKAVTLNGTNSFQNNHQDGLWVTSLGAIKVSAPSAGSNDVNGMYLDNQWAGAVGGITITSASAISINQFNGNAALGLDVYSHGLVTLSSIWANNNSGGGASINTLGATLPQNVVMTGRNVFNNNGGAVGLLVNADGSITISNLTANGNAGTGALLDNCQWDGSSCDGSGKVTLTGDNQFSNNFSGGLVVESRGNIDLSKVTADNNGGIGLDGYSRAGSITISCGSMTNNGSYGWQLNALSIITLKGVFAFGNGSPVNTNLLGGTLITVRTCPLP